MVNQEAKFEGILAQFWTGGEQEQGAFRLNGRENDSTIARPQMKLRLNPLFEDIKTTGTRQ
jgi:hypothetical protein